MEQFEVNRYVLNWYFYTYRFDDGYLHDQCIERVIKMADEKIIGIRTNQEYLQKAGMLYEGLLRQLKQHHINTTGGKLLTAAIFLLQVFLSNIWMKKFRFGPMEWVWRTITYKKRFPISR